MKKIRKFKWMIITIFVMISGFCYSCGLTSEEYQEISFNESLNEDVFETESVNEEIVKKEQPEQAETVQLQLCIYICGQVKHPGVYCLAPASRINDAVIAAGGFLEEAAGHAINLAAKISDGEKIYVPSKDEAASYIAQTQSSNASTEDAAQVTEKVNINQASITQLMTLPGIGETKAKKIIDYRENSGQFVTIEDLKNVDGIKAGTYDKIKDLITV